MPPDTVIIGTQFGDEGKGRVVDMLAYAEESMVVRYSGGPNAGHTVVVGDQTFKFHNIPSGAASGRHSLIGGGCIVDPGKMAEELAALAEANITPSVSLSSRAHVIMPYHRLQDRVEEAWRRGDSEDAVIGTTGRGIGPCYADKAARTGFRIGDLLLSRDPAPLIRRMVAFKRRLFEQAYGVEVAAEDPALDADAVLSQIARWRELFAPILVDDVTAIQQARAEGKRLIFEGAQGFGLDIEYGRYPYVSSSVNSVGGAVANGAHHPLSIGVNKSYASAVGSGAFPSELFDEVADRIVERGNEYGTTTGRRRRVGWLDLPLLRRAATVNGLDGLVITSIDVLASFDQIGLCVAYDLDGERHETAPVIADDWERATPVIEMLPGWEDGDWDAVADGGWDALPGTVISYFERITELTGLEIVMCTFGPERTMFAARGPLAHLSAIR